jgi:membrane protein DedA with SNARE-associated domain
MLDWITNTISSMGYLGIALLMLLENFFPPVSEEIIMPLAGFTVQRGELNFLLVVLAGTTGTIFGALLWYRLGKLVGERRMKKWADKHGKWLGFSSEDVGNSKRWFDKHGKNVVFFGRLVPGIRTYISIPAGFEEMPLLTFIIYSASGTLIWVGLLTYAGYALGQNFQLVEKYFAPISLAVSIASVVGIGVWVTRRRRKKKQQIQK